MDQQQLLQINGLIDSLNTRVVTLEGTYNTINTSLNNKVNKTGDSMSGPLAISNQNQLRLGEATVNGSTYVGLNGPFSLATSYNLTFPNGTGQVNQVLATDGSGNLSWVSVSGTVFNQSLNTTNNVTFNTVNSTFTGNLTGNVTGNLTGTVLTSNQPSINTLGTLTTLSINGPTSIHNQNQILFFDTTNSISIGLKAPASITGSGYTLYLPTTAGYSNYGLSTDGAGNLSWTAFQLQSTTLNNLSSYNTNGLLTQIGTSTFTGRTIVGSSSNQVIVTNGSGVNGNPTLSLPQDINTISSPTFANITLTSAPTFVGASFTGNLNMNSNLINNLGTPLVSTDAANKAYVDSMISITNISGAGSAGSIPVSNGTKFVPLSIGASGDVLTSNGTTLTYTTPTSFAGTLSHSNLLNLSHDDHTQYLLVNGTRAMSGALNMGSNQINYLATPSVSTDAANKGYVDSVAAGLTIKAACNLKTAASLGSYTTSGSGSSKTLTEVGNGALTVDGIAVSTNYRILVDSFGTTNGVDEGIYVVTNAGSASSSWVLQRSSDANGTPSGPVVDGMYTFIEAGTVYANTSWVLITPNPITVDTTSLSFTELFSSPATPIVHASLSGLSHDDHLQYLLVNGTRAMTGNLNMGGNEITNLAEITSTAGLIISPNGNINLSSSNITNGGTASFTGITTSSIASTGNLTIDPVGTLSLNPGGGTINFNNSSITNVNSFGFSTISTSGVGNNYNYFGAPNGTPNRGTMVIQEQTPAGISLIGFNYYNNGTDNKIDSSCGAWQLTSNISTTSSYFDIDYTAIAKTTSTPFMKLFGETSSFYLGTVSPPTISTFGSNSFIIGGTSHSMTSPSSIIIGGSTSSISSFVGGNCIINSIGTSSNPTATTITPAISATSISSYNATFNDNSIAGSLKNNNMIINSVSSTISGSNSSSVTGTTTSLANIIGGSTNSLIGSSNSIIINGTNNSCINAPNSGIILGSNNTINSSANIILGSSSATITAGSFGSIISSSLTNNGIVTTSTGSNHAILNCSYSTINTNNTYGFTPQNNTLIGSSSCVIGSSTQPALSYNSIIGSSSCSIINFASSSSIIAGQNNTVIGSNAVALGGQYNTNNTQYGMIIGGYNNELSSTGQYCMINNSYNSSIESDSLCGIYNSTGSAIITNSGTFTANTIIGGSTNNIGNINATSTSTLGTIIGGNNNNILGNTNRVTIIGGNGNTITSTAQDSYAFGSMNSITHNGCIQFTDQTSTVFNSVNNQQMQCRFQNGYNFYTNTTLTTGVQLLTGGNGWVTVSDTNMKEDIKAVDIKSIYEKIDELPVITYKYKNDETKQLRLGTSANIFNELFGDKLFTTNKVDDINYINNADVTYICLAVIKQLKQEIEELKSKNQ